MNLWISIHIPYAPSQMPPSHYYPWMQHFFLDNIQLHHILSCSCHIQVHGHLILSWRDITNLAIQMKMLLKKEDQEEYEENLRLFL